MARGPARGELAACYATASGDAIAAFVATHYDLPAPLACHLLHRGFNDAYEVAPPSRPRYVLRLSGHRARGPGDVAGETAFLAHLDAAGIPVAAPVPTRSGALHTLAPLPGGARPAVLFRYAEGRVPGLDDPDDARLQAVALARLHSATERLSPAASRYRLDLDHLLNRPLAAVQLLYPEASQPLAALAGRLTRAVLALDLTLTRCHGDCHGLNARIENGQATLFDFDDGGYGYLAYDLAVHLWAQISFGRRRHAIWHAFHQAYRAARPLTPADDAAIPLFVAIRHIWLLGEYAGRTAEWGSELLSAALVERETAFLLAWEQDHIAPGLL